MSSRLREASSEHPFAKRWKGASGTVIMHAVFTQERFYKGCPDYLYLFQHCATKTMCEAVVEGMGSVWDKANDPQRNPDFEAGVKEAVVAWSAPQPFHAEAKPFLTKAFNHLFGSRDKWSFTHVDQRVDRLPSHFGGAGKNGSGTCPFRRCRDI